MISFDRKSYILAVLLAAALLNLGTIRKEEDPIAKAQTDPISLKQKMEEIKDGVKGAPTPSFRYYEKEDFLTRTPMGVGLEEAPLGKPGFDSALETVDEVETEADFWQEPSAEEERDGVDASAGDENQSQAASAENAEEEEDWWMEEPA